MSTQSQEVAPAVELSQEAQGWLFDLRKKVMAKKALEEEIEFLQENVKEHLAQNHIGLIDGRSVITYKPVTSLRFDQKIAKELIPADLYSKCQKESTVRTFRLVDSQ